jgi:hypothetical protein
MTDQIDGDVRTVRDQVKPSKSLLPFIVLILGLGSTMLWLAFLGWLAVRLLSNVFLNLVLTAGSGSSASVACVPDPGAGAFPSRHARQKSGAALSLNRSVDAQVRPASQRTMTSGHATV